MSDFPLLETPQHNPFAQDVRTEIPEFSNGGVQVKQSEIHGLGLFANRHFRRGEVIGHYEGPEVSQEHDGDHVLWIYDEEQDREYGVNGQNETRFVNHSGSANACFDGEELQAITAIRAGEEITHDYGEAWAEETAPIGPI